MTRRFVGPLLLLIFTACTPPSAGPKYPDVRAVLYYLSDHLEVYEKTDRDYIVDYCDADGWHHFVVTPQGKLIPLYSGNGNTLALSSDNSVNLTEPVGGNTRLLSVNPQGIMVEQTLALGILAVHIVDQTTGLDKGVADITESPGNPGSLQAVFRPPIAGTYPVSEGLGSLYFSFNNAIFGGTGTGIVDIYLDNDGNVVGSGFTKP